MDWSVTAGRDGKVLVRRLWFPWGEPGAGCLRSFAEDDRATAADRPTPSAAAAAAAAAADDRFSRVAASHVRLPPPPPPPPCRRRAATGTAPARSPGCALRPGPVLGFWPGSGPSWLVLSVPERSWSALRRPSFPALIDASPQLRTIPSTRWRVRLSRGTSRRRFLSWKRTTRALIASLYCFRYYYIRSDGKFPSFCLLTSNAHIFAHFQPFQLRTKLLHLVYRW